MSFRKELEQLINRYSKEAVSDTPDFILAEYVLNSLDAFDLCVRQRDEWYGFKSHKHKELLLEGENDGNDNPGTT